MQKLITILILSISLMAMDYGLKPIKIDTNIWQFLGKNEPVTKQNGGNIANTYWIKTKKHWIVFDSGCTYEYAKQAHKLMNKIANLPIKMVINSHAHDDHWMGNNYYKKLHIPIYATKFQADEYKGQTNSRILNIVEKKDLKDTKIVKIDKIMKHSFKLDIDGTILRFIKISTLAHSHEDFMLYLPKEKALFSGDILMSERITSIRHGSVEGNLKAIQQIEKLNPNIYATGHGKYTDKTGLKLTKAYLLDLKQKALKAIDDDIDLNDFVKKSNFNKYKKYYLFDVAHKENLLTAYKEYEFFEE